MHSFYGAIYQYIKILNIFFISFEPVAIPGMMKMTKKDIVKRMFIGELFTWRKTANIFKMSDNRGLTKLNSGISL
jgi:hypothetical protein